MEDESSFTQKKKKSDQKKVESAEQKERRGWKQYPKRGKNPTK